jgi:hypothetical protein
MRTGSESPVCFLLRVSPKTDNDMLSVRVIVRGLAGRNHSIRGRQDVKMARVVVMLVVQLGAYCEDDSAGPDAGGWPQQAIRHQA